MSFIINIATALPQNRYDQHELSEFYSNSTDDIGVKRKMKILTNKSGISTRYSVLKDYGETMENYTFFPKNKQLLPTPSLTQRMTIFRKEALQLSIDAIKNLPDFEENKHQITHIITVTCTGLFAPGLDIELIQHLDLQPTTHRSSINFLGCNAAIIALKQAHDICNSQENAHVLIVCTELCTLHFQNIYTDDYLLSNVLFADGSAAVLMGSNASAGWCPPRCSRSRPRRSAARAFRRARSSTCATWPRISNRARCTSASGGRWTTRRSSTSWSRSAASAAGPPRCS